VPLQSAAFAAVVHSLKGDFVVNLWQRLKVVNRAWRYRIRTEPQEIAFVRQYLCRGQVAIDIGAHQGAFTYWMQKAVGRTGHVLACEPQPELSKFLQKTKTAFEMNNVTVINAGLSSSPGMLQMFRPSTSPSALASFECAYGSDYDVFTINVDTLDNICTQRGLRPVRLIKCDVEGHEWDVFHGAEAVLREDKPALLFECEERMQKRHSMHEVFDYLEALGYRGAFFRQGRIWPLDEYRPEFQRNSSSQTDYANNFVFVPAAEADALLQLRRAA
jgi:FkbM family methyltransferase